MRTSEAASLIGVAREARKNAVAPYSNFQVGAALRTKKGVLFHGCNVENATYGLTVCAERVALLSAIAAGEREFDAIAVVTQTNPPSTPCGPCRQLLWEYCHDIEVILGNLDQDVTQYRLSELFPHPFELKPSGQQ